MQADPSIILTLVVRPKNLSGLLDSMAIGSSALRFATSYAESMSSGVAPVGTSTSIVAVTFTRNTLLATCKRNKITV